MIDMDREDLDDIKPGTIFALRGVYGNSEPNDGRGVRILLGVYGSVAAARDAAKGQGVMGSDAEVADVDAIKSTNGNVYLLGEKADVMFKAERQIREEALAKLTDEEIRVLGL